MHDPAPTPESEGGSSRVVYMLLPSQPLKLERQWRLAHRMRHESAAAAAAAVHEQRLLWPAAGWSIGHSPGLSPQPELTYLDQGIPPPPGAAAQDLHLLALRRAATQGVLVRCTKSLITAGRQRAEGAPEPEGSLHQRRCVQLLQRLRPTMQQARATQERAAQVWLKDDGNATEVMFLEMSPHEEVTKEGAALVLCGLLQVRRCLP